MIGFEIFIRTSIEVPKSGYIAKESPLNESPATPAKEAPIEISQINVLRDTEGDRKITHSISFSVTSDLKSGISLDFALAAVVEQLSGSKNIQVTKESAAIKDRKFIGKISPQLVLPPGRYYLSVFPSDIRKGKSMSFSGDGQASMFASKFVVIGTVAERLEFMQNEYLIVLKHIEELDNIYKEFQKILDKSKEDGNPPADDAVFQQWQKSALARIRRIDGDVVAQLRNQGYLTFYTISFSKLHELTALLQSQLKQFSIAVIMANKNKETNFSFTINNRMPRLLSDTKAFLTKETLLNLSWFYYALAEDTVVAYETIKDLPDRLKDWQSQEAVCDGYFMKSDEFIAGFNPLIDDIWKKNVGKVGESQDVVREIKESYRKKISGDKSDALTKRLEKFKKRIGEILYNLRVGLNK